MPWNMFSQLLVKICIMILKIKELKKNYVQESTKKEDAGEMFRYL